MGRSGRKMSVDMERTALAVSWTISMASWMRWRMQQMRTNHRTVRPPKVPATPYMAFISFLVWVMGTSSCQAVKMVYVYTAIWARKTKTPKTEPHTMQLMKASHVSTYLGEWSQDCRRRSSSSSEE